MRSPVKHPNNVQKFNSPKYLFLLVEEFRISDTMSGGSKEIKFNGVILMAVLESCHYWFLTATKYGQIFNSPGLFLIVGL